MLCIYNTITIISILLIKLIVSVIFVTAQMGNILHPLKKKKDT